MALSTDAALALVTRMIGFAVALQSIEMLQVRSTFSEAGVWRWSDVRREFIAWPRAMVRVLDLVLAERGFLWLLAVRLFIALAIFVQPSGSLFLSMPLLFIAQVLIGIRWRGSFNGGSDFMTLIVLSALSVAALLPGYLMVREGCLLYIAVQSCTSYFLAGAIKIVRPNWRSGRALAGFMHMSMFEPPRLLGPLLARRQMARVASMAVMIFECAFPVALASPSACAGLCATALGFHLINFRVFGLNRFVWAWAASWPAIYWASSWKWSGM